jgi:hypothetical protein
LDVIDSVTQVPFPLDQVSSSFIRLGSSGNPVGVLPNNFLDSKPSEECGSCHISKNSGNECCRSCQEVLKTHKQRGSRPPQLETIQQCETVIKQLKGFTTEGCQIISQFRVVRLSGEFHISPGLSWFNEGWHVHDVRVFGKKFDELNLTHQIERLQFGVGEGNRK